MKQIILFAAVAMMALVSSCNSGEGYTIKGTVTGNNESLKNGKVYLVNSDRNNPVRDTADIIDGKFVFKGNVQTPGMFIITIEGVDEPLRIFLENENFVINGVDTLLAQAVVKGGAAQNALNTLNAASERLSKEYNLDEVYKVMSNPASTEEEKNTVLERYDRYAEALDAVTDSLVNAAPVSHYSLYVLRQNMMDMPVEEVKALVDQYLANPEFEGNTTLAAVNETLQKELSLQVGSQAPDFTLNDPNGNPVSLSEIYKKNKITMIDFWASWCGPCRRFNPSLVKIYKQFNKKGFEILGVSLDRDAESWKAGIKDDKLTWPHVSDLKYWNSEAAALYNVRYIPQNAFVDSEGKILARRLSEEEIVSFLEENLK